MSVGLSLARSFGGRDPHELAGQGSNLQPPDPKSGVLPIELPAKGSWPHDTGRPPPAPPWFDSLGTGTVPPLMGSLIKKRRKRMRKKKHKKLLRKTRHQRRSKK